MNPFPALTTPCPLTSLSNLSNTDEDALVANLDETSLAKGTAGSISAFLPKLPITLLNILPVNPPD